MADLLFVFPLLFVGILIAAVLTMIARVGRKQNTRHRGSQPREISDDSSWIHFSSGTSAASHGTSNANPLDALRFHQTHNRHRADDDTRRDYHQSQDVEAWDSHPSDSSSSETICGGDIGSSSSDSGGSSDSGSSDSGSSGD